MITFFKNGKEYRVLKSEDEHVHARIQAGVNYYYFPEDQYNEFERRYEEAKRIKAVKEREFNEETDRVLDMFAYRKEKKTNPIINVDYRVISTRRMDENREVARDTGVKKQSQRRRNIKNKPASKKNKRYKAKTKERIRATIAAILISLGITAGALGINSYIQYENKINEVTESVEHLSEEQIRDEIDNILKKEISEATNVDVEDIKLSQYMVGGTVDRTKVEAGGTVYKHDIDLRSPFTLGNTLSGGVRDIIDAANEAGDDRGKLIKVLKKAREFSEEKDLKVDGKKLKEVKEKER